MGSAGLSTFASRCGITQVEPYEVPVFDCAVQFDGTWRFLSDDVESFVARNPGW